MTTQQERRIAILEQSRSGRGEVRVFACPDGFDMTEKEMKSWSDLHVQPFTKPEDLIVIIKSSHSHTSQPEQTDGNQYEIRSARTPTVR